ncbi:uncharacterized protein LOC127104078 [Lathyrus oleraceus]|uniref:uncharacterized protein LOC127104078 n=1 Tax=Pisum sativum TaxID=3888 RepID=UPI0021D314F3|nr:uncharacterized protein LOC127104078 [Pisum sativum]
MGGDEKIAGYMLKVHNLLHLIKCCAEILTDKMIVENIMHILTSHFDHIIVAIQESNNLETIKLKDLVVADDHVESKFWFLDSGCSNHMNGRKVCLAYFDSSKKSKVKHADNSSLQAEGIGDIVFQRSNTGKSMIKDVLYVPGMKCNLSVGQLVVKVFSVIMKDEDLELFDTQNNLVLKSPLSKKDI